MAKKEYIEREAVMDEIKDTNWYHVNRYGYLAQGAVNENDALYKAKDVYKVIDKILAADVTEVKHGTWKLHLNGSGTCDQCHFTQRGVWDQDSWQRFCGCCGARMENITCEE